MTMRLAASLLALGLVLTTTPLLSAAGEGPRAAGAVFQGVMRAEAESVLYPLGMDLPWSTPVFENRHYFVLGVHGPGTTFDVTLTWKDAAAGFLGGNDLDILLSGPSIPGYLLPPLPPRPPLPPDDPAGALPWAMQAPAGELPWVMQAPAGALSWAMQAPGVYVEVARILSCGLFVAKGTHHPGGAEEKFQVTLGPEAREGIYLLELAGFLVTVDQPYELAVIILDDAGNDVTPALRGSSTVTFYNINLWPQCQVA